MNRYFIIFISFLLAVTFSSCNNDEALPGQTDGHGNDRSEPVGRFRTLGEAIDIVNRSMSMLDDGSKTVTRSARAISMTDTRIITSPLTRSGETDTLLYIINFDNEAGYAIVSANRNTEGLLAITDQGNYSGDGSVNPGAQMFIDRAKAYSSKSDSLPRFEEPDPGTQLTQVKEFETCDTFKISPRVKVRWGQHDPEGKFCPNLISGCVPTAISMIMSVYETPSVIQLSYNNHDVASININWEETKKHKSTVTPELLCVSDDNDHLNLARLCRQLGDWGHASYDTNPLRTGIAHNNVRDICNKIGYSYSGWKNFKLTFNNNEGDLKYNSLLLMRGGFIDKTDNKVKHHEWVLDGFMHLHFVHYLYTCVGKTGKWKLVSETPYDKYYIHCNWGWNGDSNGYYIYGIFNTKGVTYIDDNCLNLSSYNFTEDLEFATIKPNN